MTTILVGTDLSDNALDAANWAFGLASLLDTEERPATVTLVRVMGNDEMELRSVIGDSSEQRELEDLKQEVQRWLADTDTRSIDYDIEIPIGRKARTLSEMAEQRDADWLVVGKSGKGRLARLFVGSTTEHLALRPPCPLAVIHPDGFQWGDGLNVLAAVDLTESAADAAALGAELVQLAQGKLQLLHVISLPEGSTPVIEGPHSHPETLQAHLADADEWARNRLEALIHNREAFSSVSADVEVRPGYPIHEVLAAIEEYGANMLTLGAHGRSRFARFMLGGIGRSLLKKAPCSVILAPPVEDDDRPRHSGGE